MSSAGTTAVGEVTEFPLPPLADIRSAAAIHEQCRSALQATGDVHIDARTVERIDAAILQCLAALAHGLREGGRSLIVDDPTPAFVRAVEVLGFEIALDTSTASVP